MKQTVKLLTAIFFPLFLLFSLISCPEPMSDDLLAEVEDTSPPLITIISPDPNTQYYILSTNTITGKITDYSDTEKSIPGSVVSASYSDEYGYLGVSGDITLDDTGNFTISFSGLSLQNTFSLIFTAVDWNNNKSTKKLTLWVDDTGPNIVLDNFNNAQDYFYSSSVSSSYTITGQVGSDVNSMWYDVEHGSTLVINNAVVNVNGDYTFSFTVDLTGLTSAVTIVLSANDSSSNETNKTINLTDDVLAPVINSSSFPASNDTLTFVLSEGLYTTPLGATGSNAVTESDFTLELDGIPLTWSFNTAPAEGDSTVTIGFSGIPATPDGTEVLTFAPIANEVFDRVGNPANPAVFQFSQNLHDKKAPALVSASQTGAQEITVIFTENVSGGALTASYYENGTGSPASSAVYGGNNSTVILTYPNDIVIADNLTITADVITDTDGNLFSGATNQTVSDAYPPYIKDIKVWDINSGSYVNTGLYNASQDLYIDVVFSETITGTAPALLLSGGAKTAVFSSLITTTSVDDTIRYFYDIIAGDSDPLLDIDSLTGGTTTDLSLNTADLSTAGTFLETIGIDAVVPIVEAGDNKITNISTTLNSISGSDIDASASDSNSMTYDWIQTGGSEVSITNASTLNPTIDVPSGTDGGYILLLTVTDAAGNSASDTMILTWDDTPPAATAGDDKVAGTQIALNSISGSDIDASASDTNSMTYNWIQTGGSEVSITNASTLNPTVNVPGGADGDYVLLLTVTDAAGNSTSDTLTLTWDDTPPTVSAGDDKTAGTQIDLNSISGSDNDAAASDPGGSGIDNSLYSWSQVGGSEVTITNADTLNPTIDVPSDVEGPYTLRFTAVDNAGNSASDDMILTWQNGPKITGIVFADDGNNPGAGTGDTITFTFDEQIDPATIDSNLGDGGGSSDINNKSLAYYLSSPVLGVFANSFTTITADDSTMRYDSGPKTVKITLGTVTSNGTQPSGNFTAKSTIEDNDAGTNFIHGSSAVASTGKWDETAPTVTTISASPSSLSSGDITVSITYDEPITTFVEATTLSVLNTSNAVVDTSTAGSWNGDNTVYTKVYSITTAATSAGNFTVTVNGAIDLYGNVQTVSDTTNTVTITP